MQSATLVDTYFGLYREAERIDNGVELPLAKRCAERGDDRMSRSGIDQMLLVHTPPEEEEEEEEDDDDDDDDEQASKWRLVFVWGFKISKTGREEISGD